eukprot:9318406-Pyramimonas_sp.AAC.1
MPMALGVAVFRCLALDAMAFDADAVASDAAVAALDAEAMRKRSRRPSFRLLQKRDCANRCGESPVLRERAALPPR